jgi:hypothetical protein
VQRHERLEGYVELVLAVEEADDVDGAPNLLGHTVGQDVTVTTEAAHADGLHLEPGARVVVGAELRGPGAVWSRPNDVRRA